MWLATLALFVVSLGYGVVVPALPKLAGTSSASELSVVYASYAAAKILAQVPGGVWVDRVGHRRVLGVALLGYTLSLVGFLLPFGPAWFAFVRAVEGAATGLVYPAVFARVLSRGDESSGKRIGAAVGVGSSGLLAGPVMGALLPPALAIEIAAGLGGILFVLAVANRTEAPPPPTRTVRGEIQALFALAKTRAFLQGMLPIGFNKLTFSSYQGLLPLVGIDILHVDQKHVAGLFVLVGVVFALAQPVAGGLVDRIAPPKVVLLSAPLLLAGVLGLAFTQRYILFAAFFGAHIFAQSLAFTATMKHAAKEHGTTSTYGGVFGLLSTLTDTMTIVGPLLFLNLYGAVGQHVFAAMAAIGLLAIYGFSRR